PHPADPRLHGVPHRGEPRARPALRPDGPAQAVRRRRGRVAGARRTAPRGRAGLHGRARRGGAPRGRLRRLPLGRPGTRDPGAARPGDAGEGSRRDEHRHDRAAGGVAAARCVDRRGVRRIRGTLPARRPRHHPRGARGAAGAGGAMTIDLATRPLTEPWGRPETWWPRLAAATADLDPPFGVLALDALAW